MVTEHRALHLLPHTRCLSVMLGMFPCPQETAESTCGHILGLLVSQSSSGPSSWEVRVDSTGWSGWRNLDALAEVGEDRWRQWPGHPGKVPCELSLEWSWHFLHSCSRSCCFCRSPNKVPEPRRVSLSWGGSQAGEAGVWMACCGHSSLFLLCCPWA